MFHILQLFMSAVLFKRLKRWWYSS